MISPSSDTLESFARKLALVYLLLLVLPLSLWNQRIFLHDALLPLMGLVILYRHTPWKQLFVRYQALGFFLLVALVSTAIHATHALSDTYEWLVFAYQAVLLVFYAGTAFSQRQTRIITGVLFTAVMAAFLYELTPLPSMFSFLSPEMDSTAMPFLAKRFAFTLKNPNLFGVFYAIPCALATRCLAQVNWQAVSLKLRLGLLFLPILLMLPILSSASKHGILCASLFLAWPYYLFPARKAVFKPAAILAVLGLALVFELTVLFTTFPLTRHAPFITTTPGMYSLHQTAYAHMVTTPPSRLILGLGAAKAKEIYPDFVNRDQVATTLKQYNADRLFGCFTTFMDPHQEYLNLICLFGLPAACLLIAFWVRLPQHADPTLKVAVILFVIAVFAAALWDDLFSKRYLWIAAAILVPTKETKP